MSKKSVKKTIFINSQLHLDRLTSKDCDIVVIRNSPRDNPLVIHDKRDIVVVVRGRSKVLVKGQSVVVARDRSLIIAFDKSKIKARERATVIAHDESEVELNNRSEVLMALKDSHIIALDNSKVTAYDNTYIEAYDQSKVTARGNVHVEAHDFSIIDVFDNSCVEAEYKTIINAHNNSIVSGKHDVSITAFNDSQVLVTDSAIAYVYNNTSVIARGNSNILCWGGNILASENVNIIAYDYLSIEASGNTQVINKTSKDTDNSPDDRVIIIGGNARIVQLPSNVYDFIDYFKILHDPINKKLFLYKAVHKVNGEYYSDMDPNFKYELGEERNVEFDGITFSGFDSAMEYGIEWDDVAILEAVVYIKDALYNSEGYRYMAVDSIRASKYKIIREVPLSELGIYSKIIENRKRRKEYVLNEMFLSRI